MKLFAILTVCLATVLAQRGDVLIEEDDTNTWNAPVDEWDGRDWRGDTPSWGGSPGPIVSGSSFGVPVQNQVLQPVATGNSPTHFRIENGYLNHMGKSCKVIKGYGGQSQFSGVYQKFGHPGLYQGENYFENHRQQYADVYQGSPMYSGENVNYNSNQYAFGTVPNYHSEYASNIITTGGSSSYPEAHISYPGASSQISYPSTSSQVSYPSATASLSYPSMSSSGSYTNAQYSLSYPNAQSSLPYQDVQSQMPYTGAQSSLSYPNAQSPMPFPGAPSSLSYPNAQSAVSYPTAQPSVSYPNDASHLSFPDSSQQVGSAPVFQTDSSSLSFPGSSNQAGGFSSGFPSPAYPGDENSYH